MQVGIDIGATKIESVILKKNGQELGRYRIPCSKNYNKWATHDCNGDLIKTYVGGNPQDSSTWFQINEEYVAQEGWNS